MIDWWNIGFYMSIVLMFFLAFALIISTKREGEEK